MTTTSDESALSRREREVMDILFSLGEATGQEITQRMPDALNYSTVRTILRILERKGYVRHRMESLRYVYEPVTAKETARKSALARVLKTFFEGSAHQAAAALLDPKSFRLSKSELDELSALIEQHKRKLK